MAHAAEIAFALFAYVCGEEDGNGSAELGVAESGGEAKQRGEAGGVVAGSGSEDAGVLLDGFGGGFGGKDGVEMRGEEDNGRVVGCVVRRQEVQPGRCRRRRCADW